MLRKRPFIILSFLLFPGLCFAQPKVKDIEKYIEHTRAQWNVPGMAVAIVYNGAVYSNRGYGVLKEGENQKADKNTLFAIASNTKAFISSAIGVLQDEGKLSLQDQVVRYVPEFQVYDSYATEQATVEDLLCHRIGLGTYSGDIIWYKSNFTEREVVEKIRYVPQAYGFRAGYGYSNLMFITAGEVIKEASGMPWDQFVSKRFFVPLGMDRTLTSVELLNAKGNYASPHKPIEDKNIPIDWVNWDNMGAAGGIISSSSDMAKWLMFQLNNGIWEKDTILTPKTQNILWTPHNNFVVRSNRSKDRITNFSGYGLGWSVKDYYGYKLISHGGGYDGMYSLVVMVPEMNLGIVILTNSMKGISSPLQDYILNAFMGKEQKDWSLIALEKSRQISAVQKIIEEQKAARVLGTKPTFATEKYTGTYHTDMVGNIKVSSVGGEMVLKFDHAPGLSAKLVHWHYDTWEIKWDQPQAWFDFGTVQFHYNNDMDITGFVFDVPNEDIFFDELNVRRVD